MQIIEKPLPMLFTGLVVLSLAITSSARAQESSDDALLSAPAEATTSGTHFLGDLWLDQDHVSGLLNGRTAINRTRGRLRAGIAGSFSPAWEFVASARIAQGSDDNRDNRRNNDNERSDGFGIDQILLRWRASDHASLQFGKAPLP
ncbi:hypothetical protein, partial [Dokdonella sp.]|uniref:hypothetical protein n=1 Tax=Dokdonella sp. TaxID=2291710 RepID=UPI002B702BC8